MTEADPSMADRIVAEFGDGYEVEGIAARHGLTVEQVFALVEREVGPARPERYPPAPSAAPAYQLQGFANPDAIVAEYGDGHDIAMIARRHGITVEQVYLVVQQVVADDPRR